MIILNIKSSRRFTLKEIQHHFASTPTVRSATLEFFERSYILLRTKIILLQSNMAFKHIGFRNLSRLEIPFW
jgi:hypothetical protein